MNWLTSIVQGLFAALFGWGQSQAEKPRPMQDANTPDTVKEANQEAFEKWKKEQDAK